MKFSIIIPTWNNLEFLKLCIRSIRENSKEAHQIIVHVNEGIDGTLDWVKSEAFDYTASEENIGVCLSTNHAALLAREDYIVFMNDDMYCCPGWDTALSGKIASLNTNHFLLSGRLIEPVGGNAPQILIRNFGSDVSTFKENDLLSALKTLPIENFYAPSQPIILHKEWWAKIGGYSVEFSPGMGSDNDLAMKMWATGCRIFLTVGNSFVYHFGQKSTKRIATNNSRLLFMRKWGLSTRIFYFHYLYSGVVAHSDVLPPPLINASCHWQLFRMKLTLFINLFR